MFSIENILTVYLVILQFIFLPLFIYIFVNTIINEVRRVKSNREFNQFMEDKRYKKYDDSDKYEYEITDEEENMHNTEQFGEEILDKLNQFNEQEMNFTDKPNMDNRDLLDDFNNNFDNNSDDKNGMY